MGKTNQQKFCLKVSLLFTEKMLNPSSSLVDLNKSCFQESGRSIDIIDRIFPPSLCCYFWEIAHLEEAALLSSVGCATCPYFGTP